MNIEEKTFENWTPINLIDFDVKIVEYKKENGFKFYLKKDTNYFGFSSLSFHRDLDGEEITPEFDTKRELYKYILENYKKINKNGGK